MNFKKELTETAISFLKEELTGAGSVKESTAEMLDTNIYSWDNLALDRENPGKFTDEELTDVNNLANIGPDILNSESQEDEAPEAEEIDDLVDDLINLGGEEDVDDGDDEYVLHITQTNVQPTKHDTPFGKMVGEALENEINSLKEGSQEEIEQKVVEESKEVVESEKSDWRGIMDEVLKESDYAGPLDYVPDTRFNVSDVLNVLKADIGAGSEGINVVRDVDGHQNPYYRVTQIDKSLLPDEIQVETVILKKLGDDVYQAKDIAKEYPLKK